MIDWNKTEKMGYNEYYFKTRLQSHKKVYRICDKCGNGSWTEYRLAYKLCRSCSVKKTNL